MANLTWDSPGVLLPGLTYRERGGLQFFTDRGNGIFTHSAPWVNSCSVFVPPPWLFTWASHYFMPWVNGAPPYSCEIRAEVLSVSYVWGMGTGDTVLHYLWLRCDAIHVLITGIFFQILRNINEQCLHLQSQLNCSAFLINTDDL